MPNYTCKKSFAGKSKTRPSSRFQVPKRRNPVSPNALTDSGTLGTAVRVVRCNDPFTDREPLRAGWPCGRCGCKAKHHNPPKAYTAARDVRNMGPYQRPQVIVQAKTCCDSCPTCICFCVGFVEPFPGQPFERCVYDQSNQLPVGTEDTLQRPGATR